MNLQDIENIFWGDRREQPTQVRLARVVKALREEAGPTIRMLQIQAAECFPEINERGQKHFVRVVMESAAEELKEILGDAGAEKVAGSTNGEGVVAAEPNVVTPTTDPIRDAVTMARGRTLVVDDIPTLNKLAASAFYAGQDPAAAPAISTPTPKRVSIGVDPNKNCQWDPVKDSDRLWFAWCKTQPGIREYQIAPRACPVCNLPVKTMEGTL